MKADDRIRVTKWLALLLCTLAGTPLLAQDPPWTAPLRGSWVQTGSADPGYHDRIGQLLAQIAGDFHQ